MVFFNKKTFHSLLKKIYWLRWLGLRYTIVQFLLSFCKKSRSLFYVSKQNRSLSFLKWFYFVLIVFFDFHKSVFYFSSLQRKEKKRLFSLNLSCLKKHKTSQNSSFRKTCFLSFEPQHYVFLCCCSVSVILNEQSQLFFS